jgi:hypothetical protein
MNPETVSLVTTPTVLCRVVSSDGCRNKQNAAWSCDCINRVLFRTCIIPSIVRYTTGVSVSRNNCEMPIRRHKRLVEWEQVVFCLCLFCSKMLASVVNAVAVYVPKTKICRNVAVINSNLKLTSNSSQNLSCVSLWMTTTRHDLLASSLCHITIKKWN